MASTWRQLLPQFLIMLLIYFVAVFALAAVGLDTFIVRIVVALAIAFGYPAALRYFDRAPPAWQR